MILYSSSQKHSISRAAFAKVAGIGTEVALHVPFEVSVERRRVEVVEEAHGDDAAIKMALELEVAIDLAVAGFGKVAVPVVPRAYAERVAAILVRVVEVLALPVPCPLNALVHALMSDDTRTPALHRCRAGS